MLLYSTKALTYGDRWPQNIFATTFSYCQISPQPTSLGNFLQVQKFAVKSMFSQVVSVGLLQLRQCMPNPALNLAPFGRWTLRETAAQRRLALR